MIENDVQEPLETFHIYPLGDGFFIRKEEEPETVVDSTPPVKVQPRDNHGAIMMFISSLLMASLVILTPNSPIAEQIVITHTFTLSGDLRSHMLPPVTSTLSQTVVTTGRGHEDATHAKGFLTFFNGTFTQQVIPQDMIFSANGTQIVTDSPITLPAANPPLFGQASVPAHALHAGAAGNISAYTIDTACCALSVKAVNTSAFVGGRNARDYHVVARKDIVNGATPLTQSLYSQEQKVLHAELTPDDTFIALPCSSTVSENRRVGEEATSVKVTVAATCSGSAYSRTALQGKVLGLLHVHGDFRVTSFSVHVVRTTPTSVLVTIKCSIMYSPTMKGTEKWEE